MSTGKERYAAWLLREKAKRAVRDEESKTHILSTDPIVLSYLAGIIDGEGSIGIVKRTTRRSYSGHIAVQMCEPGAVQLLRDTFGGYHGISTRQLRPEHRPQFVWSVACKKAGCVAQALLPYLRVKVQQARNLIELQQINQQIRNATTMQRKNRTTFSPAKHGPFEIDPMLLERSEALCCSQRLLNQRGNPHVSTAAAIKPAATMSAREDREPPLLSKEPPEAGAA